MSEPISDRARRAMDELYQKQQERGVLNTCPYDFGVAPVMHELELLRVEFTTKLCEMQDQLAAARAEMDAASAERDHLRQAASVALSNVQAAKSCVANDWRGLCINAESILRHAIKHTKPLTPDTEAT